MTQTVRKELLAQLQHLRMAAKEISRLYVANPTRDTAQIVASHLDEQVTFTDFLIPDGNPLELIRKINDARVQRVLLVGHEPDLSGLISILISGGSDAAIELKKGGLCRLTAEKLIFGQCATLNWLLTPKQLRAMR